MSDLVIKTENVSKLYRLGNVSAVTFKEDAYKLWAKIRGKEYSAISFAEVNDRTQKGHSDYVWALKNINFDVKQGEVLGIIGSNGAGKSTLMKILSKVTAPTTGNIKVRGRIASLLEVGTGFHPELTGTENIYLNGHILGMTKREIDRKFDEIVDFAGVEKYLDTPVKRYSSGMYVRLAFAVAAHLEPEILIIDEVLAVGDAEFQKKCMGKMKDVSTNDGRTVLFISHNILAVKSLCDRGMWLDKGKLMEIGEIESITASYLSNVNQKVTSFVKIEKESKGFSIHEVSISNNGIDGHFNISDDLTVNVLVSGKSDYETININIFFNTIEGAIIFATCSPAEKFTSGKYLFQCIIPANTMNDITYILDIMVVQNGPLILHHLKEILHIEGIEARREGGWLGKHPGLLRPLNFVWKKATTHE